MNKILAKTIIPFLLFGITSCSYKPIFLKKNYDFEIREINLVGDKDINRTIKNKLKFIKNDQNNKKNYNINIESTKTREIVSKDSKGDPVKFEISILVEYRIMNENNILLRPLLSYTGEHEQEYVPIENRK